MDLPPLQQYLSSHAAPRAASGISLDVGQLPAGSKLLAKVVAVQALDGVVQQRLTKHFASFETRRESSAQMAPARRAVATLLTKPQLFAVQLSALGRQIMAVTEFELRPRQTISLYVRRDGQLQVDTSRRKHVDNTPPASPANTRQRALAPSEHAGAVAKTPPTPAPTSAGETLSAGLRQYLPRENKVASAFVLARQVINAEQQAQMHRNHNNDAPAAALKQLSPLLAKIPTIEQVTNAPQLKQALINSGTFLEAKLAAMAAPKAAATPSAPGQTRPRPTPAAVEAPAPAVEQDIKAELLRVIKAMRIFPASAPTSQSADTGGVDKLIQSLFLKHENDHQTTIPSSRQETTAARLSALLFSALARISSLQLRHLLAAREEGHVSAKGGFLELPVRASEQIFPLTVHIQEDCYDNRREREKSQQGAREARTLKKSWRVYLEFDLDDLGTFAGEIRAQDKRVKTKLWVQRHDLWREAQSHLNGLKEDLQQSGIDVAELLCQEGEAPTQRTRLERSLVDVKT